MKFKLKVARYLVAQFLYDLRFRLGWPQVLLIDPRWQGGPFFLDTSLEDLF